MVNYEVGQLVEYLFGTGFYPRHGEVVLHAAETDEFRTTAWWMQIVAFTRDAEGRPRDLLVSGGRVRDIRFRRR